MSWLEFWRPNLRFQININLDFDPTQLLLIQGKYQWGPFWVLRLAGISETEAAIPQLSWFVCANFSIWYGQIWSGEWILTTEDTPSISQLPEVRLVTISLPHCTFSSTISFPLLKYWSFFYSHMIAMIAESPGIKRKASHATCYTQICITIGFVIIAFSKSELSIWEWPDILTQWYLLLGPICLKGAWILLSCIYT